MGVPAALGPLSALQVRFPTHARTLILSHALPDARSLTLGRCGLTFVFLDLALLGCSSRWWRRHGHARCAPAALGAAGTLSERTHALILSHSLPHARSLHSRPTRPDFRFLISRFRLLLLLAVPWAYPLLRCSALGCRRFPPT